MQINEITLKSFIVRVRVVTDTSSAVLRYKIDADGQTQARMLAKHFFGQACVLCIAPEKAI